jgi:hypothetical protein
MVLIRNAAYYCIKVIKLKHVNANADILYYGH